MRQVVEPRAERDVRDLPVRFAQKLRRLLHPDRLQERREGHARPLPEQGAEVGRREVNLRRHLRQVEILIEMLGVLFFSDYTEVTVKLEETEYFRMARRCKLPMPQRYHKITKQIQRINDQQTRVTLYLYFLFQFLNPPVPIDLGRQRWLADVYGIARLLRTDFLPKSFVRVVWMGERHTALFVKILRILDYTVLQDVSGSQEAPKCITFP